MLEEQFEQAPSTDINPDECVSLGAALTAALEAAALSGEEAPVDISTRDVTSHSLGLAVYRDNQLHNSRIIRKNTPIPAEESRDDYITTHDGQSSIDLWLVQGEETDPLACAILGHFEFYGIPARPAGQSRLSITYRYNANGIVEVEAIDKASGQVLPHKMSTSTVSLEDIAAGRAPLQVAVVLDCSGSLFGAAFEQARSRALDVMRTTLMVENRQVSLIGVPGGVLLRPTQDLTEVEERLARLTPVGNTALGYGLARARSLLRPRAGLQRVFVVITDGHANDDELTLAEVERIKTTGGRVMTVGVGPHVRRPHLESLATRPQDYIAADQDVEIEGAIVNLVTELAT
jgi:uncharacterized protein YegL